MEGWIKLHRQIIDSRVFTNPDLLKLWILCLTKANHKQAWFDIDGLIEPVKVLPGQFITGRYSLHHEYYPKKIKSIKSEITLWRWLQKLEKWGKLNIKSTTKYSLIEIINWNKYQLTEKNEHPDEQQVNNKLTTNEHQLNTNKNENNAKNEKNIYGAFFSQIPDVQKMSEPLTEDQFNSIVENCGLQKTQETLLAMQNFVKGNKGIDKLYKSANLTCRSWIRNSKKQEPLNNPAYARI